MISTDIPVYCSHSLQEYIDPIPILKVPHALSAHVTLTITATALQPLHLGCRVQGLYDVLSGGCSRY